MPMLMMLRIRPLAWFPFLILIFSLPSWRIRTLESNCQHYLPLIRFYALILLVLMITMTSLCLARGHLVPFSLLAHFQAHHQALSIHKQTLVKIVMILLWLASSISIINSSFPITFDPQYHPIYNPYALHYAGSGPPHLSPCRYVPPYPPPIVSIDGISTLASNSEDIQPLKEPPHVDELLPLRDSIAVRESLPPPPSSSQSAGKASVWDQDVAISPNPTKDEGPSDWPQGEQTQFTKLSFTNDFSGHFEYCSIHGTPPFISNHTLAVYWQKQNSH